VSFFGIFKSQQYVQTSSGAPVTPPTNAFAFNAFVYAAAEGLVTNATVRRTGSGNLYTLLPDFGGAVLRYEYRTNSQAGVDAVFPNGNFLSPVNYTVSMETVNDGLRGAALNFSAAALLGSPPVLPITDLAAAQAIDTAASFTLRWNASGGQFIDLVQVVISNSTGEVVYTSPAPFTDGGLTGSSNSVLIPAYTLPPGTNLTGHLTIVRPVGLETNTYPGAIGVAGIVRDTEFLMVTRPLRAPRLEVVSSNAAPFRLSFTGESNRTYHLQATTNFLFWQDLFVTNLPSTNGGYTDPASPALDRRFYRLQVGP